MEKFELNDPVNTGIKLGVGMFIILPMLVAICLVVVFFIAYVFIQLVSLFA